MRFSHMIIKCFSGYELGLSRSAIPTLPRLVSINIMGYPVSSHTVSFARAYAATKGTYVGFKIRQDMLRTDTP